MIRKALESDSKAISALIHRSVRISNRADYPPATIDLVCREFTPEKIVAKLRQRDMFIFVRDHVVVGTVSFADSKLHSLFVEPVMQRQGIGARLVGFIEDHAMQNGFETLRVSSSITAQRFYKRLGYRTLSFEERENGSTFLMEKLLSAPAR